MEGVYTQILLAVPELFIYKIPAMKMSSGHRAEDWNLANPMLTGCLRIYRDDVKEPDSPSSSPRASSVATSSEPPSSLRICLYSLKDGTSANRCDENLVLFGECPVKIVAKQDITPLVDAVVDSSRYYVLKLQDRTSKKSAYIGIGFRDREIAFDFKNTLNEHIKYIDRLSGLTGGGLIHEDIPAGATIMETDMESFLVTDSTPAATTSNSKRVFSGFAPASTVSGTPASFSLKPPAKFSLKPPPAPGATATSMPTPVTAQESHISAQPAEPAVVDEEDEWDDFVSS